MGPDTSYAKPMAERMTASIVQTLRDHGFTRPDAGSLVVQGGQKWDDEVAKVQAALHELIMLDAADKF
jgi:hypothetical protein